MNLSTPVCSLALYLLLFSSLANAQGGAGGVKFNNGKFSFPGLNAVIYRAMPFAWEGSRRQVAMMKDGAATVRQCETMTGRIRQSSCPNDLGNLEGGEFAELTGLNNLILLYRDRISGGGMTEQANNILKCVEQDLIPTLQTVCDSTGRKLDFFSVPIAADRGINAGIMYQDMRVLGGGSAAE